jgi:hypothetical protein
VPVNLITLLTEPQAMRSSNLNLRFFADLRPVNSWAWGWILPALLSSPSFAESTNKRMILPGSRAQALAGAFTAVASDASAGWYNPAGLGFLKGPGVSASVNNFSTAKKRISEVVSYQDLTENSASIYPGFTGANTNLGPLALAWSYFTLEQQNTDESQIILTESSSREITWPMASRSNSSFRYDRTELTAGSLIHTGVSLAVNLSKNVSLGISEFYYRRQKQTTLKERSSYESGVFYDSFSRLSTKNEGTLTVAGLLIRGTSFSLGISAKIPRALSDKTDFETSYVIYTGGSPDLNSEEVVTHREDELTVRTWSLGLAWTPLNHILVSADAVYYAPTKTLWGGSGGFDTRAVTDWSVGVELQSSGLIIAGGAFSNSSLAKRPEPSSNILAPGQINYLGFSSAIGFKSGRLENVFIMVRQRGLGQKQMVQGNQTLQSVTTEAQTFSLASSYKF